MPQLSQPLFPRWAFRLFRVSYYLQTRLKWITSYRCLCGYVEVGARSHIAGSGYRKLEFGGCCLIGVFRTCDLSPSHQPGYQSACFLLSILETQYCQFFVLPVRWKIVSKSSPNVFKDETMQNDFPFVPSVFISSSLLLKTLTYN